MADRLKQQQDEARAVLREEIDAASGGGTSKAGGGGFANLAALALAALALQQESGDAKPDFLVGSIIKR